MAVVNTLMEQKMAAGEWFISSEGETKGCLVNEYDHVVLLSDNGRTRVLTEEEQRDFFKEKSNMGSPRVATETESLGYVPLNG